MARPIRVEYDGAFYHVTSRGNERKRIFSSENDKGKFLEYINLGYLKFGFKIHAYCLMDNHYHLMMETPRLGISRILQYINSSYSAYINRRNKRSGHLLGGRPKIILVEAEEYAVELSRYIHLNPIRARIVGDPREYAWSSVGYYMANACKPEYMETDYILSNFGRKRREAQKEYLKFMIDGAKNLISTPFEEVKLGMILGSKAFTDEISEKYLNKITRDRELSHSPNIREVLIEDIQETVRNKCKDKEMDLEKLELYIARKHSSLTMKNLGRIYDKSISAVNECIRRLGVRINKDKDLKELVSNIEEDLAKKCNV